MVVEALVPLRVGRACGVAYVDVYVLEVCVMLPMVVDVCRPRVVFAVWKKVLMSRWVSGCSVECVRQVVVYMDRLCE